MFNEMTAVTINGSKTESNLNNLCSLLPSLSPTDLIICPSSEIFTHECEPAFRASPDTKSRDAKISIRFFSHKIWRPSNDVPTWTQERLNKVIFYSSSLKLHTNPTKNVVGGVLVV